MVKGKAFAAAPALTIPSLVGSEHDGVVEVLHSSIAERRNGTGDERICNAETNAMPHDLAPARFEGLTDRCLI